jgi:hypothetical protein
MALIVLSSWIFFGETRNKHPVFEIYTDMGRLFGGEENYLPLIIMQNCALLLKSVVWLTWYHGHA